MSMVGTYTLHRVEVVQKIQSYGRGPGSGYRGLERTAPDYASQWNRLTRIRRKLMTREGAWKQKARCFCTLAAHGGTRCHVEFGIAGEDALLEGIWKVVGDELVTTWNSSMGVTRDQPALELRSVKMQLQDGRLLLSAEWRPDPTTFLTFELQKVQGKGKLR